MLFKKMKYIFSLCVCITLFASCGSEINVKMANKNLNELQAGNGPGSGNSNPPVNNQISLSNLVVSNIQTNGFDVSLDYMGDDNSNSVSTMYMCNETRNPGCIADAVGQSAVMLRGSSVKTADIGPLLPGQYTLGEQINLVVITTDSEGVTIGARLATTFNLLAATPIYRSVGALNTTALATGAGNALSITNGRATFALALPDRIGIGDALEFDNDNNGTIDEVLFISEREDAQNYQVRTVDGSLPTDLTGTDEDWNICRAYSAIQNAVLGNENTACLADAIENFDTWSGGRDLVTNNEQWNIRRNKQYSTVRDLVTNNEQWNIVYYADAIDEVAVFVDNWTTSAETYLKIYAPSLTREVGVNQRHEGVLDYTKSLVRVASSGMTFRIDDDHVWIDGLQIVSSVAANTFRYCIRINSSVATGTRVSNNILINGNRTQTGRSGIYIPDANTTDVTYIYNNIFYGHNLGIEEGTGGSIYAYNNTFVANGTAVDGSGSNVVLKNNLAVGSTVLDYSGGIDVARSENNISSDASAPGTNSKTNAIVIFNEPAIFDFRIAGYSYPAIGTGVDLSNDPNLSFNTDIRGATRTRWDIGASTAPRMLMRSIGPSNTTTLQNGAGNDLSIAVNADGHTQATFAIDVNSIVGVGDVIQYDPDNTGGVDTLAFISMRIDSQNYIVKNVSGDNAVITTANSQSWDIFRAYTSMDDALDFNESIGINVALRDFDATIPDLVTDNQQLYYSMYADALDTGVANYSTGLVTSNFNHMKLFAPREGYEVGVNQRHYGVYSDTYARTRARISLGQGVIVEGIQVNREDVDPTSGNQYCFTLGDNISLGRNVIIKNNIVKGTKLPGGNNNDPTIRFTTSDTSANIYILNNIIMDGPYGIYFGSTYDGKAYIYNNTIMNAYIEGVRLNCETPTSCDVRNNIARSTGDDFSFTGLQQNNISYDATSGSGVGYENVTVSFLNEALEDYRLSPNDLIAKNRGYVSGPGVDERVLDGLDITGNPRVSLDVGAHEAATAIYRSVGPGNTAALATGAGNDFTITLGIANFASALPTNIGVGDAIQFDNNNGGAINDIVFIHGRVDSQNYIVRNADGTTPSDMGLADQDWSIFRAYTGLETLLVDRNENTGIDASVRSFDNLSGITDLVSRGEQWNVTLYADAADGGGFSLHDSRWATGPTRGMRIFTPFLTTEVGERQRHEGVWSDSYYRLMANALDSTFQIHVDHVTLEGIQINSSSATDYRNAISVVGNAGTETKVINNIVQSGTPARTGGVGINVYGSRGTRPLVANNIVYGFSPTAGAGIRAAAGYGVRAYNNTIVDSFNGLICLGGVGVCECKNNISESSNAAYTNCDVTTSDSNIANDTTAVGTNPFNSTTASFHGRTPVDYRLASTDYVAKNAGVDLSTNSSMGGLSDIMGKSRGTSWDIGAHEAANDVYRSFGASTVVQAGTGIDLTISGSVATFSVALADNVGVGDAIQYDSTNDGSIDAIAFIHRRNSATSYVLADAAGNVITDMGTADQDWEIYRAYSGALDQIGYRFTSENSSINGTVRDFDQSSFYDDFRTFNINVYLMLYAEQENTSNTNHFQNITSSTNRLNIIVPKESYHVGSSQRHSGVWDDSRARINVTADSNFRTCLTISVRHFYVEGIQCRLDENGFGGTRGMIIGDPALDVEYEIHNSIIKAASGSTSDIFGIRIERGFNGKAVFSNNIIYGFNSTDPGTYGIMSHGATIDVYLYNNTLYDNNTGVRGTVATWYAKNNLVVNSGAGQTGYTGGNFDVSSTNNLASDATAPGASPINSGTITFNNSAGEDFRLASTDTDAENAGVDLSTDPDYPLSTDITGRTRAQWDLGAYRYIDFANLTEFDEVGDGSTSDPYQIFTREQLIDIGADNTNGCNAITSAGCDLSFDIQGDLDLTAQAYTPIGDDTNRYTGTFDCQNNTISNLNLGSGAEDFLGLIGVTENANVRNCVLDNFNVDGDEFVGALVGTVFTSNIENIQANSVTITGRRDIGGVIGRVQNNPSVFDNINSSGTVTGTEEWVGGVIGRLSIVDTLTNISSTANVTGAHYVGGVFGWVDLVFGSFSNIYATGDVVCTTTTSDSNCGGALGLISRTSLDNAYATGTVSGSRDNIGGLIGNGAGGIGFGINDSYALGDVIGGVSSNNVGGLVGRAGSNAAIIRSFAAGDVKSGGSAVGGLVGISERFIHDSFSLGRVEITAAGTGNNVGGLVGHISGSNSIERSWSASEVVNYSNNALSNAGGLVGDIATSGNIINSYAYGNVLGRNSNVGGFVGVITGDASLTDNFATGNATGYLGNNVGGFVGYMGGTSSSINRSYATGSVKGFSVVGGFAGYAARDISNSYSTGNVRGNHVAGFIGTLDGGALTNNYSISYTEASGTDYGFIRTLTSGTLSRNYFNYDLNGINGGPSGLFVAGQYENFDDVQFKTSDNFDSGGSGFWDYTTDWTQLEGRAYPIHKTSVEGRCADNISTTVYTTIGNGDIDNPYVICNREQWDDMVANGCGFGTGVDCDKHFALGADIDFRESFTMIGALSNRFNGVFNGRNKILKNIYLNTSDNYIGLFKILEGTALNLNIRNTRLVTSGSRIGTIAGQANNAFVLNSFVESDITNTLSYVGGIVGEIDAGSVLAHLSYTGVLDGNSFMKGGIVGLGNQNIFTGHASVYATIDGVTQGRCGGIIGRSGGIIHKTKTFGSVSCTTQTGGITGGNHDYSTYVSQSYSHMDITGTTGAYNGGLYGSGSNIGASSQISDSYSRAATINGNTFDFTGGIGGARITANNTYADNTVTSTGSSLGGILGFGWGSANFWNSSNGVVNGRSTNGSEAGSFEALTNATVDDSLEYSGEGWDVTNIWQLADNIRPPMLRWDLHPQCQSNPTAITFDAIGLGTHQDPYVICFKEQFLDIGLDTTDGCNASTNSACGAHFVLMNDLDFKGETMAMIGDATNRFTGYFYGNNHIISNVTINQPGIDNIGGIFSVIWNATIRDLELKSFNITGQDQVGLLAGDAFTTNWISGIKAEGVVNGRTNVGGLIGYVGTMTSITDSYTDVTLSISGSYGGGIFGNTDPGVSLNRVGSRGNIVGTGAGDYIGGLIGFSQANINESFSFVELAAVNKNNVGGLVGQASTSGSISYSYSGGVVDGNDNVGGFIGSSLGVVVSDSYSLVSGVGATGNDAGGFIGELISGTNTISRCYSAAGSVTAISNAHGFLGNETTAGTLTNNYWDNTLVSSTTDSGRFNGLVTTDMDNSGNFTGWDTTSTWRFPAGGYPELVPID